jgi:hypothetical protein
MFEEMHFYCGFIGLFIGKTHGHAMFSVKKVRFTVGLKEAKKVKSPLKSSLKKA